MAQSVNPTSPDNSADAEYRYRRFTMRLLLRDLRFGKRSAKAGDQLPPSTLFTADGARITSAELANGKPVLLVFGSLTCPMTASAMPVLKDLHNEFGSRVEFVMLNVREAHPGEHYPQPDTIAEKIEHARQLADLYAIPWTVVSDDVDGSLHRSLDAKPNSAFLFDANSTIVFRALWGSDRSALRQALSAVADGRLPVEAESTTLVGPVVRAMGHVHEVMESAGPQAVEDLWRGAFPMALTGRVAILFKKARLDRRGFYAVTTLACLFAILVSSIATWAL